MARIVDSHHLRDQNDSFGKTPMNENVEIWSPERTISEWMDTEKISLRQIEEGTGISRSKLSKFKRGAGTLTVSDLVALGEFLGRDPRKLFNRELSLSAVGGAYLELGSKLGDALMDTVGDRISSDGHSLSIEDVMIWHIKSGGHLYKSNEIKSHLLALEPVEKLDSKIKVVGVGQNSLIWNKATEGKTHEIGAPDIEDFISKCIPEGRRSLILEGYRHTHATKGRQYFDRELVHMSGSGKAIFTSYFSLLMPGFWHDGKPVVWNFSKEIYSRAATLDEVAEIQDYLGV